jgi:hypothetical protein
LEHVILGTSLYLGTPAGEMTGGLLCRLLLLPLLAGWPERVRLVDGVVDPDEEGPASADSLFLRLRCLTGGVTPLVPGEELVGGRCENITWQRWADDSSRQRDKEGCEKEKKGLDFAATNGAPYRSIDENLALFIFRTQHTFF